MVEGDFEEEIAVRRETHEVKITYANTLKKQHSMVVEPNTEDSIKIESGNNNTIGHHMSHQHSDYSI
jgi:hypothetical protein